MSPRRDFFFFFLAPWVGLFLAILFFGNSWAKPGSRSVMWGFFFSRVLIHSHILLVVFRSHFRPEFVKRYPYRMLLAPLLLFFSLFTSNEIYFWVAVLGAGWDIYHSSMQNFGIARIYHVREGHSPEGQRKWDLLFCLTLYVGPLLISGNFIPSLNHAFFLGNMAGHAWISEEILSSVGMSLRQYGFPCFILLFFVCISNALFFAQFSPLKHLFLANIAVVTFYAWTRLPFPIALVVVNFYHALQYHAIVHHSEKSHFAQRFRFSGLSANSLWGVAFYLVIAYGILIAGMRGEKLLFCLGTTLSILHYWYDGFIWSVRRGQI